MNATQQVKAQRNSSLNVQAFVSQSETPNSKHYAHSIIKPANEYKPPSRSTCTKNHITHRAGFVQVHHLGVPHVGDGDAQPPPHAPRVLDRQLVGHPVVPQVHALQGQLNLLGQLLA